MTSLQEIRIMSEDFLAFQVDDKVEEDNSRKTIPKTSNRLIVNTLPPWLPVNHDYSDNQRPFVRLHNEIVQFVSFLSPKDSEISARELVVSDLQSVVSKLWPDATIHVFGSQMTNLLIPCSDMDVTIMNVPMTNDSNRETIKLLESLADVLRYHSPRLVSYLEVVSSAKFPIIKLDHKLTGISVDICINNSSGIDTGNLMRNYLQSYPMLRPLALVIKVYLAQRRLHETYNGGIGSFVLLNMIISMIQQRQRVAIAKGSTPSWNLGALLVEFFRFYGSKFNYITTGISISNAGYYCKQSRGDDWGANKFTLSLENPDPAVQPPVDIGKNSFMIAKVRRSFEHASQVLTSILSTDPTSMVSYLAYLIRQDHVMMLGRSLPTPSSSAILEATGASSIVFVENNNNFSTSSQEDEASADTKRMKQASVSQVSIAVSVAKNQYHTLAKGSKKRAHDSNRLSSSQQIVDLTSSNSNSQTLSDGEVEEEDIEAEHHPRKRSKANPKNEKSFSILGGGGRSSMADKARSQSHSSSSRGNSYLQQKISNSKLSTKRSYDHHHRR
jgi:DNA polymerase sigma